MLNDKEVKEALEERRHAKFVLDTFGGLSTHYSEFQSASRAVYSIYDNNFDVIWPDGTVTQGMPKIANFTEIAANHRSREVAASRPSLMCAVSGLSDKARQAAEKRERILRGYWAVNNLNEVGIKQLALDQMLTGLSVVEVLPDTSKPMDKRYPKYRVLSPLSSYPEPIFAPGPYVDSFVYDFEASIDWVEKNYGVTLGDFKKPGLRITKVHVIVFYDDTQVVTVVEANPNDGGGRKMSETISAFEHQMGRCPVVVSARPSGTRTYRSEFWGALGITNTLNRMVTMMLDDAFNKTYAQTMSYDIENPEETGPGAHLIKTSKDGSFEWIAPPNQPFSNLQVMRDLTAAARAANIFPPSASGDPNESIISAAGVSATNAPVTSDVRDLQTNTISPLLRAANELALCADQFWCDVSKPIGGQSGSTAETYTPSKDIAEEYSNQVTYGQTAGLDPINTNVMALQQLGAGAISLSTFMEQSIFVEDVPREQKKKVLEQVDMALQAGLITQAQSGGLDAATLAELRKQLESDDVTLHDAVANVVPLQPAPLAPPASGSPGGAPTQAPGLAGAGEGQSLPQNMPPLAELLG